MTPMMKLINALNALVAALQEIAGEETKAELSGFVNIYTPTELEEESGKQPQKEQPAPAEPAKEITVADVRKLLAEKSRMGYKAEVMELVHKHGADKVSSLKESEYAAVMKEAEQIGK